MASVVWLVLAVTTLLTLQPLAADARTLVWARASDALSLDPHAINEGPTNTLLHQIYEPLLIRDARGKLQPALAVNWTVTDDPRVWTFEIRQNVVFHDGTPLTVDDVIFSLERARKPTSDMKTRMAGIDRIEKVDDHTILIATQGRDPLLPMQLTDIFIMSLKWAKDFAAVEPQNFRSGATAFAARQANGTGPFMLVSREPGRETRLSRNPRYWQDLPAINELVYRVIPDGKARVEALLKGDVDFIQDVPVATVPQLAKNPAVTLRTGPENRVIFLGLNVTSRRRTAETPDAPNPLFELRVRQAIDLTLDRRAIQRDVMSGQSIPTAVAAPPTINGYPQKLDHLRPPQLEKARGLLAAAGYPKGFTLDLDCPDDRYVNDAAICRAVAKQMAAVGITLNVKLRSKSAHFPLVRNQKSDLYLLGWGVPTFDSEYLLRHLYHSAPDDMPAWNGTGYDDPAIDRLIESIATETDLGKRNQHIADVWWRVHAQRVYIPIHVQTLTYAMRKGIDIAVDLSDSPKLKFAKIAPVNPN